MATGANQKTSSSKVEAYRARLRANGLRPIQIWVPDTRTEKFHSEAHDQSLAVAASQNAIDDQLFIDSISLFSDK